MTSLAIGGFVLSFSALRDLAVRSGIPDDLAFIWPLIVDGFIVVATAAAFALKGHRHVTWYPWSALVLFSAISVTCNALHATDLGAQLRVPVVVATVVSAVPAIALLLASHLLVVMAGARSQSSTAASASAPTVEMAAVVPHVAPPETAADGRLVELADSDPSPPREIERSLQAFRSPSAKPADERDLVAAIEAAIQEGAEVTGALVGELAGVSARTGRRRMEQLRATHPHLFQSDHNTNGVPA